MLTGDPNNPESARASVNAVIVKGMKPLDLPSAKNLLPDLLRIIHSVARFSNKERFYA